MKKLLLSFFAFTCIVFLFSSNQVLAAEKHESSHPILLAQGIGSTPPADGTWLPDSEVTFAGKNASRAKDMFNWTLVNYKWAYQDNPLVDFWVRIRNIVFAFLILLVLIAAFSMIVTGGQSLRSVIFVRKFIFIVLLIAFSFAMIRFLYQINDVIIGFFVRNPNNQVISSKDLLNISFDYVGFSGYRRYGMQYDEAAFVSLLLVKITAFTYFVMAAILLIRKVILWFFITVSPIYPLLLFYYPIRNTAKIWIGEFFRWLLYAPLFTIFLNALVQLWRSNISILPFNFATKSIVYPTAVNILLGGPGQTLAIDNNVNFNDTFVQYVVALIMVWVVILLPFLLLKIFLDYLSTINISKDKALNYINTAKNYISNRDLFVNKPPAPISKPPPGGGYQPGGAARTIPYISTGAAMQIPRPEARQTTTTYTSTTISKPTSTAKTINYYTSVPKLKTEQLSRETARLVNFSIPTMRDVARFETQRLTAQTTSREQLSQIRETLQKIANPYTITNTTDRQQFSQIREKLFQQKVKGDTLASSILNAANNITNITNLSQATTSNVTQQRVLNETLQKIASPASITNAIEQQQFSQIREELSREQQVGNPVATSVMSVVNNLQNIANQQSVTQTQFNESLQKIASPETITNTTEREQYTKVREVLQQQSQQGNNIATTILNIANQTMDSHNQQILSETLQKLANPQTIASTREREQYSNIKESLVKEQQQGNPIATAVLSTITNTTNMTNQTLATSSVLQQTIEKLASPETITDTKEKEQYIKIKDQLTQQSKAGNPLATSLLRAAEVKKQAATTTLTATMLPTTNDVQTVNLDDYEEVKRMWGDNYQHVEVPKSLEKPERTRSEWITDDVTQIKDTVSLLTSSDQQQVTQGMQQVSTMLPFLLIGGFSQTEVVAYLKAKQKAAEEVLEQLGISKEQEETQISREVKKRKQAIVQHRAIDTGDEESYEETPLESIQTTARTVNLRPELLNTKTLSLVTFPIPTMSDIARYEAAKMTTKNPSDQNLAQQLERAKIDIEQAYEILQKIANPSFVSDPAERQQYEQMRQIISREQKEGNPLASSIMSVANAFSSNISTTTPYKQDIVNLLQKIENPEEITNTSEKDYYTNLKETLLFDSKNGSPLASAVLSAADKIKEISASEVPTEEERVLHEVLLRIDNPAVAQPAEKLRYEQIKEKLIKDSQQNDPFAIVILLIADKIYVSRKKLSEISPSQVSLPAQNQVQTVNLDDYEDVKKMWIDNYKNIDVPQSMEHPDRTRAEWIQEDMKNINHAIDLLTSNDKEKAKEGMNVVSGILPFLLIGGFSLTEIIAYLKAKKNAAQEVLDSLLSKPEEFVETKEKKEEQEQMKQENEVPSEPTTEEEKPKDEAKTTDELSETK